MKLHSETYEKYKPCDGEWVNTIPEEWQEKRVKDLFRLVTEAASVDNDYELLSLYASIGVRPRKDMEAKGNKASSTDGYWIVKKNDIVVNKLLAWMGSVGLSEYDGVTSPAYDVLRQTNPEVEPKYFAYLFRTETAKKIFRKNSRGIMDMRLRLYFDKLGAINIPVPIYQEQINIANYIDTKVLQIDCKITLLKKKLEAFEKLKNSIIFNTVKYGLDREVELEDSNIEKIGKIPKHWKIKRFKEIFRKTHSGWTPDTKKNEGYGGSNIWITIKDMDQAVLTRSKNTLSDHAVFGSSIPLTPKGSLLFSFKLSIGKVAFAGCDLYTNEAIITIEKEPKVNLNYFYYSLPVFLVLNAKENIYGAKLLNQGLISNTPIPLPPEDVQDVIADYLENRSKEINEQVSLIQIQIDKQKELRIAVINDAVTGRIKVSENNKEKGQTA